MSNFFSKLSHKNEKFLTFRDVKVENTLLQDSHATMAITSWMWVKVQNLVFTHCGTENKEKYMS